MLRRQETDWYRACAGMPNPWRDTGETGQVLLSSHVFAVSTVLVIVARAIERAKALLAPVAGMFRHVPASPDVLVEQAGVGHGDYVEQIDTGGAASSSAFAGCGGDSAAVGGHS